MLNVGKLAGYTLFVTGASRGIGKEIALKAARDGANVVIAAKTAQPHPKLPGTIYSAAEEIEKAGGKCLPCVVDVRSEEAVQAAVDEAVRKFGGIDILINNASAISLTGTLATSMKTYDLMNQINARGTYMCSKVCLPHLINSKKGGKNPHILNISPPLNLKPIWFKNHTAYSIAKFGMSLCVLGMADELKPEGIAVNALWPRTAIDTAAMDMLGGGSVSAMCRKPSIMADAAYAILIKDSSKVSGEFAIDDEVLKKEGITDMDQYAVEPGRNLMPDFFVDTAEEEYEKSLLERVKDEKASVGSQSGTQAVFDSITAALSPSLVGDVGGIFKFEVKGDSTETWVVNLKDGGGSVQKGDGDADVTITTKSDDFVDLFSGKLDTTQAFMQGKVSIKGNMGLAMKLGKVMKAIKSAPKTAGNPGDSPVADVINKMQGMLSADLVEKMGGVYQFKISGDKEESWVLDLKSGDGSLKEGTSDSSDVTLDLKSEDFVKIFTGKLNSTQAFMQGKLKIKGNMGLAMKLEKLVKTVNPQSHL